MNKSKLLSFQIKNLPFKPVAKHPARCLVCEYQNCDGYATFISV